MDLRNIKQGARTVKCPKCNFDFLPKPEKECLHQAHDEGKYPVHNPIILGSKQEKGWPYNLVNNSLCKCSEGLGSLTCPIHRENPKEVEMKWCECIQDKSTISGRWIFKPTREEIIGWNFCPICATPRPTGGKVELPGKLVEDASLDRDPYLTEMRKAINQLIDYLRQREEG